MILLTITQLLDLNEQGIIPGPAENEEDFIKRAEYCLTLKDELSSQWKAELGPMTNPFTSEDNHIFQVANLYDIRPQWIPLFFSNYQMMPWHGGCAWIFQMTEESPTAAFLQLRKNFKRSPTYLGIYNRQELIAHELAHIGRMKFEEPHFEEILAYRTSSTSFRKWLGPIVRSSIESMLFVLLLGLICLIDVFLLASGNHHLFMTFMWLKSIPIALCLLALGRLWRRQNCFDQCLNKLTTCLSDRNHSWPVIYRLTDAEISLFAKWEQNKILHYAEDQSKKSLRWRLIQKAYFKDIPPSILSCT